MTYKELEIITKDFKEKESISEILEQFNKEKPLVIGSDTETTGLDMNKDKPFLISFGWLVPKQYIKAFSFWVTNDNLKIYKEIINKDYKYHLMHNAKFDIGMLQNVGVDLAQDKRITESMCIPKLLFSYYDWRVPLALKPFSAMKLGENSRLLEEKLTDELKKLQQINRHDLNLQIKNNFKGWDLTKYKEHIKSAVKKELLPKEVRLGIEKLILQNQDPTYKDVGADLVQPYATNDVVLMLQLADRYLGSIINPNSPLNQKQILEIESDFARALVPITKNGMKVNLELLETKEIEVAKYINEWYQEFWRLIGEKISIGQHKKIKEWFIRNNCPLITTNDKELHKLLKKLKVFPARDINHQQKLIRVIRLIRKLRTFEKWYATYIVGYIKKADENYMIYTDHNSLSVNTGRLSSSWQQFPREALTNCFCSDDQICSNEEHKVYHPREMTISRYKDGYIAGIDYSQMELRVGAEMTRVLGEPDRAFLNAFYNYEKVDEWKPLDLHANTAQNLFKVAKTDKDFSKKRQQSKNINFGILYGGSDNVINNFVFDGNNKKLSKEYYETFKKTYPGFTYFQEWCANQVMKNGQVKNTFGRIFKWKNRNGKAVREAGSCMVQGACAYFVKKKVCEIQDYLTKEHSCIKIINMVHDEVVFDVPKEELERLKVIKEMMENQDIWEVPLVCELSYSQESYAKAKG